MQVESLRFGSIDVQDDRLVELVHPFLGFDQLRYFAFIDDAETAPVFWMQSVEQPEVLFPVVDAGLVIDDYGVDLSDDEVEALGLEQAGDARLLLVLTLSPDPSATTVNLRAPIVWNPRRATAIQVVNPNPELPIRHPVRRAAEERRCNKEVARACPDPT